ncbi:MAG: hypothetical protein SPL71_02995 [Oribacterium sp.]|nr:hypothetical protein [Oribacterium sp.]
MKKLVHLYRKPRCALMLSFATKTLSRLGGGIKSRLLVISDQSQFRDPDHSTINIYQSANSIIADIKASIAHEGNAIAGDVKVVALASVQGGSGKSTIAYALAIACVRAGKQAMFLNLEEIPSIAQFYKHEFKNSIDNLIYEIQEGNDFGPVLTDTLERDENGVLVLPPFHSVEDLLSLSEADISRLLDAIAENGIADFIFVDLPNGFHKISDIVEKRATTVLHIFSDTMQGREKLSRMTSDNYFIGSAYPGASFVVLNRAQSADSEAGIDLKFPNSNSLQRGDMVANVEDKNPMFLKSCMNLMEMLR